MFSEFLTVQSRKKSSCLDFVALFCENSGHESRNALHDFGSAVGVEFDFSVKSESLLHIAYGGFGNSDFDMLHLFRSKVYALFTALVMSMTVIVSMVVLVGVVVSVTIYFERAAEIYDSKHCGKYGYEYYDILFHFNDSSMFVVVFCFFGTVSAVGSVLVLFVLVFGFLLTVSAVGTVFMFFMLVVCVNNLFIVVEVFGIAADIF